MEQNRKDLRIHVSHPAMVFVDKKATPVTICDASFRGFRIRTDMRLYLSTLAKFLVPVGDEEVTLLGKIAHSSAANDQQEYGVQLYGNGRPPLCRWERWIRRLAAKIESKGVQKKPSMVAQFGCEQSFIRCVRQLTQTGMFWMPGKTPIGDVTVSIEHPRTRARFEIPCIVTAHREHAMLVQPINPESDIISHLQNYIRLKVAKAA